MKGEEHMKLENRLKELRARDRLNQTELAKKAGVSRQTVSLIERGEYAPSVIIALKIAHIFGENVENVFYLKENSDEKMDENYGSGSGGNSFTLWMRRKRWRRKEDV